MELSAVWALWAATVGNGHRARLQELSVSKFWYLLIFAHLPTSFGDNEFDYKVAVALLHVLFQTPCA
jgi:hypothetical protein